MTERELHSHGHAAVAVAQERNACATLADEMADRYDKNADALRAPNDPHAKALWNTALALRSLASAIRARGMAS